MDIDAVKRRAGPRAFGPGGDAPRVPGGRHADAILRGLAAGTRRDQHPKGPSIRRSVHYCIDCEEPFEAMG